MDVSLQSLINLYVFSTGRRLFALAQVMKAAEARSFAELEAHCAIAIKHDRQTRILENQWAAPAERQSPVQPVDAKVDKLLVSIRDVVQSNIDGEDEEEDLRKRMRALLTTLFPEGVLAVIKQPYIEELASVDRILDTLKAKEAASLVAELGLGRKVKKLAKLAVDYRAALEEPQPQTVGWDKVRAAQATGQDLLLQAVVMILAKHRTSGADDIAGRLALLGPILEQDEAIGRYLKSRRAVEDVNPETGAPDPSAPLGAAPSAAPAAAPPAKSDK